MNWSAIGDFVEKFGVFIAALLATGGYLWRLNTERQRTTRRVLYCLLEIRAAAIQQFIDNPETDKFIRQMLNSDNSRNDKPGFYELRGEMLKLPDEYIRDYKAAIHELSKDRPFLAAELRGTEKFHEIMKTAFKQYSSTFIKLRDALDKPSVQSESLTMLSKRFAESTRKEITALDDLIIKIAKASGVCVYLKTKKLLVEQSLGNYAQSVFNSIFSDVDESKVFKNVLVKELTDAKKAEATPSHQP